MKSPTIVSPALSLAVALAAMSGFDPLYGLSRDERRKASRSPEAHAAKLKAARQKRERKQAQRSVK